MTIPADIYNSGILIEVDGIDVRLRFLPDEARQEGGAKESQATATGSDGEDDRNAAEGILPSTTDLAQSFLESEPKEETEELQAVLKSQSQHMQHPDSGSDDGDEELGLHDGVSLPSFVAGFLKGIVNRLQLKISNVSLRVDMEVQRDKADKSEAQDPISGLFTIQSIAIDSVATTPSEDRKIKIGKRLVSLSEIRAMIVSDAEVFSNHSRFNVFHATSTVSSESMPTPPLNQSPPPSSSGSDSFGYMSQSTILDPSSMHESHYTDNYSGPDSRHLESSVYSNDGRFSDAASDDGSESAYYSEADHGMSDSHYEERFLDNPAYLEEALQSHYEEDLETSTRLLSDRPSTPVKVPDDTPRPHSPQSAESSPESQMYHSIHESKFSVTDVRRDAEFARSPRSDCPASPNENHSPNSPDNQRELDPPSITEGDKTSSHHEDLSASRIFTHEEAHSMYMSAISHASVSESSISEPDMPGGWGTPKPRPAPVPGFIGSKEGADNAKSSVSCSEDIERDGERLLESLEDMSERQRSERNDDKRCSHTPQALSGFMKELFSINEVALWIPSVDSQEVPDAESSAADDKPVNHMAESVSNPADSAIFDLSAKPKTRLTPNPLRRGSVHSTPSLRHPAISRPKTGAPRDDDFAGLNSSQLAQAIEVEVNSLSIKVDIASGWLLIKMGQRITDVWSTTATTGKSASSKTANAQPGSTYASVHLISCSLHFLECVPEQPYPLSTALPTAQQSGEFPRESTILHLTLSRVGVDFASIDKLTKVRLGIQKFVLGHMSHEIVSFNESMKMHESTRDISSSAHGDIFVRMVKSPAFTTIHLTTLPVCFSLNLQQLDDTLSWLGGLSTVLELGNSIASTSTIKGGQVQSTSKPRSVHFADPTPPPGVTDPPKYAVNLNCRIGGVVVQIIGEHCALRLRTTAAKLVGRSEGLGLQIDGASLSGPHLHGARDMATAFVDITNTRIEYLHSPRESDLDRLLRLLTPSVDGFDEDDDIMLETLFRQRRNGAVLRLTVGHTKFVIEDPGTLQPLSHLSAELSKLATVAKYLPQDDRPGMLILANVRKFEGEVHVNRDVGDIAITSRDVEVGYVTFPTLVSARVSTITVVRNNVEELIAAAKLNDPESEEAAEAKRVPDTPPVLMVRFVADDMEPTIKAKLHSLRVEYTVPCLTALMGEAKTAEDVAANMAQSVLNLAEMNIHPERDLGASEQGSVRSEKSQSASPHRVSVALKDCVIGLNPRKPPAKALVVFSRANFTGALLKDKPSEAFLDIRKAVIMVIDDVDNSEAAGNGQFRRSSGTRNGQIQYLQSLGFVPVCDISSASAHVKIVQLEEEGQKSLDVEIRDDLLVLETCADSTQTLISILSSLAPLAPPSVEKKYRTEVISIEDMLNSFSGNAFAVDPADNAPYPSESEDISQKGDDAEEIEYVSVFYPSQADLESRRVSGAVVPSIEETNVPGEGSVLGSFHSEAQMSSSVAQLDFQEDHFAQQSAVEGTAHRWDSNLNTYSSASESKLCESPLRVRIRDVHAIWNLYDGYDWQRTRDTISKAVQDVEAKAAEKLARRPGNRLSADFDEEEESVIGDFLFNSVYIGIPANRDPKELSHDINRNIDDLASETMSFTSNTTVTGPQNQGTGTRREKLRLARSKHHKMTFELKGISADLVVFPPGSGETLSSLDVRVQDLEIFDHVPTSTWKKFATYMQDAGEREIGTSMVHLEIMTVKPVEDLAASEFVIRVSSLCFYSLRSANLI